MSECEHDPLDLASRMFTLCDMADSELVRQWAGEARELLNEHAALKQENAALKRENDQKPAIKISDGDVWLVFPDATVSIEGICNFGAPGPIVKRNLRAWRDALLTAEEPTTKAMLVFEGEEHELS